MESNDDIVMAITENTPSYQSNKIIDLYEKNADDQDYYNLAKKFLGEDIENSSWINTGPPSSNEGKKSFFDCLKNEIYLLFCSDDNKYSDYRQHIDSTVSKAVGVAVGAIATALNVQTGLIAGAITCVILCIYKLGKNAWCATNCQTSN